MSEIICTAVTTYRIEIMYCTIAQVDIICPIVMTFKSIILIAVNIGNDTRPMYPNSMNIRKGIMRSVDDCIYVLFVITYALKKSSAQMKYWSLARVVIR